MRRPAFFPSLFAFAASVLVAACAVGPDFTPPPAPGVTSYDAATQPCVTADGTQVLLPGADIPAAWWDLFRSDSLNRLVKKAIKDNPDLQAASASLRIAQDDLAAGDSELLPTVSAGFSSQRQKTSGAQNDNLFPGYTYTLHNASVSVSYGVDLFGGTRRAIEQLQAQSDDALFEQEAAYLSLTGNVVTAAIQEASLRDQIAAAKTTVASQQKILTLLEERLVTGAVARSAVAQQRATLAAARAALPPLEHQLAVQRHLLSVLAGQLPQQEPAGAFTLAGLSLPQRIPLSVPSRLVEQRPDIRAAQENLHAASAGIGIAVAARLPDISLTADLGSMATTLSKLFTPGGGFWSLGGSTAETIFDAGALADKEQAARDNYDLAAAQYRKTVLAAFQDVADTLHALQSDAVLLSDRIDAEKAASESLSLIQTQYKAGAAPISDLLSAEIAEQNALSNLAQARAQRYADTAALFVALGGGWWNRDKPLSIVSSLPAKGSAHD